MPGKHQARNVRCCYAYAGETALGARRQLLRTVFAIALLCCAGLDALWATTPSGAHGPTVHRSTRTIPRRFVIHPNGVTVSANQTQRFGVTDSEGRPVVVRWNVSGSGCDGVSCGMIDDQGVYRPPSSLPAPRVVILEGVVVADPRSSVLTEIRLETVAVTTASSSSVPLPARPDILAPPHFVREDIARAAQLPGLPRAITPPPTADGLNAVRRAGLMPLSSAVPGVPPVPRGEMTRNGESLLVQHPIGPAPTLGRLEVIRTEQLPPLASVVAAPPPVERQGIAPHAELIPLPHGVDATPVTRDIYGARTANFPLLASAIAAPQSVGVRQIPQPTNWLPLPPAIGATPAIDRLNVVRATNLPPLPSVISGAPLVPGRGLARYYDFSPLPSVVGPAPAMGKLNTVRTNELLTLASAIPPAQLMVGRSSAPATGLPPLPQAIAASPIVEISKVLHTADLLRLPSVVASAPTIERQNVPPARELPLPHAVQAVPVVEAASRIQTASMLPLASAARPMSPPSQVLIGRAQDSSRPAPGTSTSGTHAVLLPVEEEVKAAPAANIAAPQHRATVAYQDGLLTIDVRDMTLAEVLKLVAQKTGATIEVPPGSGLERIVEHAGPGPAKDVLTHLLDGSSFNFVIVSSPVRPQDPAQVVLSLQRPDTTMPGPAPAATATASSVLWTPPDETTSVAVLPAHLDDSLTMPKETLTPEALSEFMRAKFQEIREKAQQQYPQ